MKDATKTLVGKYFHSFLYGGEGEPPQWQGEVVAAIDAQHYLVQLFSWFDGCPTCLRVVPLSVMTNWEFYATPDAMHERYRSIRAEENGRRHRASEVKG